MQARLDARLGVGFVGLSATRGWAAQAHLPALAMLPGYEVRGLVGSRPDSAASSAAKFGVPFATDHLEELLARPEIDLVVVTLVVTEHKRVVEAALEAGKAVLCEWPLARDVEQAKGLADLAQRKNLPGFVGLQARHSPGVNFVRDLIAQGFVGEVLCTSVTGAVGAPWGLRSIEPRQVFYQDKQNGATLLSIPFGHAFDAICSVLGELEHPRALQDVRQSTTSVRGTGEIVAVTAPDQLVVSGKMGGQVVASFHYRAGIQSGTGLRWEINGTHGDLVINAPSGHLQFGNVSIRGASAGGKELVDLPIPDRYWPFDGDRHGVAYNVALMYDAIARDMRTGTRAVVNFADALARHRSLEAIEVAANR